MENSNKKLDSKDFFHTPYEKLLEEAFLSSVAEGLFFFFSHRADNRFIKGIVGTYEQRVGLAFFLQMAACFFHFVAFLVAMLSTYFAFTSKGATLDRQYSLQHSSKTNMTNVGRSMDFEQQQHPVKADEFDRAVADSMPELSHARSYQSDIQMPGRIRRKSETCV
uniref:Uncharacterized protein n=1 Tax=Ditylenchus dipsaci TaxID=166011 RepID=A0A915E492_9BILA